MNRRNFLRNMFGAAVALPLAPVLKFLPAPTVRPVVAVKSLAIDGLSINRDYYSIEWPVVTRDWTFGTYAHETLMILAAS